MNEWDPRPVLLYFHYPHEEDDQKKAGPGKATLKQCKELDEEKAARWTSLFHCVEVDVTESAKHLISRFGTVENEPSFAIVDRELKVLATSEATNRKKFVAFLRQSLPKFEEYWKTIQERLEDQKATLKAARAFQKKKDLRRALNRYDDIRRSEIRIAKWWDEARKEADQLEARLLDDEG